MNFNRSIKSIIHEPNGLREGYAFLCQASGTLLSNILLNISYKSWLMITNPSIALSTSIRVDETVLKSLLNLNNYCWRTVFIDY